MGPNIPKCQYYVRYNHYLHVQFVFIWFILDFDHIKAKARKKLNINVTLFATLNHLSLPTIADLS